MCRGASCVEVGAIGARAAVIEGNRRRHVVVLAASGWPYLAVPKLAAGSPDLVSDSCRTDRSFAF